MSDTEPEGFAPPAPPAPPQPSTPPTATFAGGTPAPQLSGYPQFGGPPLSPPVFTQPGYTSVPPSTRRPVNRLATAAYLIASINVGTFLIYRLLGIADSATNSDAFEIFYCVIGCVAIAPFVLCVVFGHLGMAAGRRLGGLGRGPAGFALGVGYLSIMLWVTALASALATMIMSGPSQPFYESFYI